MVLKKKEKLLQLCFLSDFYKGKIGIKTTNLQKIVTFDISGLIIMKEQNLTLSFIKPSLFTIGIGNAYRRLKYIFIQPLFRPTQSEQFRLTIIQTLPI